MTEDVTAAGQAAAVGRSAIADRIRLMRPSHWLKNVFIFVPLIFGLALDHQDQVVMSWLAFGAFCLVSSAVYILNDIRDREADAEHPRKRFRPIASGRVSVPAAAVQMLLLAGLGGALTLALPWQAAFCVGLYALLNVGYSFGLKHVVILDVFTIAAGFMLRVLAGAKAIEIPPSEWLVVCTLFLSLFLAVAKRRSEMNNVDRGETRRVLDDYTPALVTLMLNVSVAGTIMCYTLYTVSDHVRHEFGPNSGKLIYTVPIVLFGLFRYLYLDEKRQVAENPVSVVARDPSLLLTGLAWGVMVIAIIYWPT